MEVDGKLTATQAKAVLADMVAAGATPTRRPSPPPRASRRWTPSALEAAVDAAIAADPAAWEKFVGGDDKVAGAFVGPVMKATKGKADGKAVNALLRARRDAAREYRRREAATRWVSAAVRRRVEREPIVERSE